MSTLIMALPDYDDLNNLIKDLSITHKKVHWDESLSLCGSLNNEPFVLKFRNYRKQRYIVFINSIGIIKYDKKGYITGHYFIAFIKQCLNATINDAGVKNLYDEIF